MRIDIIRDRALIGAARRAISRIPLVWWFYGMYWSVRHKVETRRKWKENGRILDFGAYAPPSLEHPVTQLCTSEQMTSPLYRDWCNKISSPARYSRKQWEFVFIMQALEGAGMLVAGRTGIGFGCGREPLPGVFAKAGANVVATDLGASEAAGRGWIDTLQHAASLEELYTASRRIIDRDTFAKRVSFMTADMNEIPADLHESFDFVWSACALEHLGSLQHGIDFIRNSARCLKPGGIAVHTTEFNLSSNDETVEHRDCSVYRRRDIERLETILLSEGLEMRPLNLSTGTRRVDRHVDFPPYSMSPHIRLELEGHVVTSIGIVLRRVA